MEEAVKDTLMKNIAGEIILSENPGEVMRKWRELFGATQLEVAELLKISPSVISDYEGGRRRSPGAGFIRRFVKALLEIDERKGSQVVRQFSSLIRIPSGAILGIREFSTPITVLKLSEAVQGEVVVGQEFLSRRVLGYTVIESLKAILTMSGADFLQVFGSTTERALVFVKTRTGRSPMVAVRVHPLKPAAVVLHGVTHLDFLAKELAIREKIPLIISRARSEEQLLKSLAEL